jgi:hypothetical protein
VLAISGDVIGDIFGAVWNDIREGNWREVIPTGRIVLITILILWGFLRWKFPNYTPMLVYLILIGYPMAWYDLIEG